MRRETAIKKAKEGYFEFIDDAKQGDNLVRYQTPSGKWKEKVIHINHVTYKRVGDFTLKFVDGKEVGI